MKLISSHVAFILLCLIVICSSGDLVAQEDSSVAEQAEETEKALPPVLSALGKVQALREELKNLEETTAKAKGEEKQSLVLKRKDKSEQLMTELQNLKLEVEDAAKDEQGLFTILEPYKQEILRAGRGIREEIRQHSMVLKEVIRTLDTSTLDGLKSYKLFNVQLDLSVSLLDEYIEIVELMGFEASPSHRFMQDFLPQRLDELANHVRLSAEREDDLEKRLNAQPDDAEIKAGIDLSSEKLDFDTESLRKMMAIAQRYDIEVNQYHSLLMKSTGEISSDILDVDVMSVVLRDWWAETKSSIRNNSANFIFKIVVFVLILLLFKFFSALVARLIKRSVQSDRVHISYLMQNMLISLSSRIIFILGLLVALAQVGVSLGPVLAGLGVAGFVIGFALQDTLGNFAAGMMILFYRPYDVGDVVEAGGAFGKVQSMNIVSTTILTFDNQTLIIPNSKIWGDVIKNVTAQRERRVDMTFGIGYGDDIDKAESVLKKIVAEHPKVLETPEPTIRLHTLGESSVDFIVRPWAKTADYWEVYWDITREVKKQFDAQDISIPFPQRDVHLYKAE